MSIRSCLFSILVSAALVILINSALLAQTAFLRITDPIFNNLNPAVVLPTHTFRWQTAAGSAEPSEVRHALALLPHSDGYNFGPTIQRLRLEPDAPEWSSWEPYIPSQQGMSWTTSPLQIGGKYVFAVQGRDTDGNAETLDEKRNIIRTMYIVPTTGPLLTVTGDLISPITTISMTTAATEIAVASGAPLTFCWTANSDAYGAYVTGYRYQWDIANPDDESQWQMPYATLPDQGACSLPLTFESDTHRVVIEVIDSIHTRSRVQIIVHVTPLPVAPSTWGSVKALYRSP